CISHRSEGVRFVGVGSHTGKQWLDDSSKLAAERFRRKNKWNAAEIALIELRLNGTRHERADIESPKKKEKVLDRDSIVSSQDVSVVVHPKLSPHVLKDRCIVVVHD